MNTDTESPPDRSRSFRFGVPIVVLLVVLALLTGGLLRMAVRGQDAVARQASETVARAALNSEREATARLVRDYSWWNDAVENLIFSFNPGWVEDNLDWLHENFGVSRVFVFGPRRSHLYASLDAQKVAAGDPAWAVPGLLDLVDEAAGLPDDPTQSASAYVAFADGIHLVSASKLLEEADKTGHPPYPDKGILVVSRKIDDAFLERIEHDFELPAMSLSTTPWVQPGQILIPLTGAGGAPAAYIIWTPPQPGQRLMDWLRVPLGLAFLMVAGAIGLIVVRARRAGLALQEALDAQLAAQKQLEYAARHDSLTGLPNRALFLEHLQTALAQAARNGSRVAVHYLDLDGFKKVNDTLGHPAGDALLQEMALRLGSVVRSADTAARFGGDEFAVLQRDVGDRRSADLLAARLIEAAAQPFELTEGTARVSISDGIAFSSGSHDPEQLVREADRALYRAKRQGGNRFKFNELPASTGGLEKAGCPTPS